jgi:uncharacterized glyoxalase superfamily metalloenzyme YdcJ
MSRHVETWQLRAKFAPALSQMYGAEVPADPYQLYEKATSS